MRVLLIEDDPDTAESIALMLRAEKFVVDTTEFGEDGLLSVIQSLNGSTAEALVAGIINAVAGEKQDDVTVVAVRVL